MLFIKNRFLLLVCVGFFVMLIATSSFADGTIGGGEIVARPVNNKQIVIPALAGNNPNSYYNLLAENFEHASLRRDGSIRDEFVPFSKADEYVSTLPNVRKSKLNRGEAESVTKKELCSADDVNEYFVMRQRVLAPTMIG